MTDPPAIPFPPELIDRIAEQAAEMVAARVAREAEPWLGVEEAATYLACPRSRVYDLVGQRRVRVQRDGRRLLFRRAWLDAALESGPPPEESPA